MKRLLILGVLVSLFSWCSAQYPVSMLPEKLAAGANAVVRQSHTRIEVESLEKATLKKTYVATVLNSAGISAGNFVEFYDDFRKVRFHSGKILDGNGKTIAKLSRGDLEDASAVSAGSVFTDHRVLSYEPGLGTFPFTVIYDYEIEYNTTLFLPNWVPVSREYVSIEHASLQLSHPEGLKFLTLEHALAGQQAEATGEVRKTNWKLDHFAAIGNEPLGPDFLSLVPYVELGTEDFMVAGYAGSQRSWKDLGIWVQKLNEDREGLPEAVRTEIGTLVAGVDDPVEKARILYAYLQENTRYVSIQLGIGGYQPWPADFVYEKKYGDCKALSHYLKSMLDEVGVKSHYALVKAGRNNLQFSPDFPSLQFNHVILCLPTNADTLWLECTSQTNPFGYQGRFTDARKALLITENGGKLVDTRMYTAEENLSQRRLEIELHASGEARFHQEGLYTGLPFDKMAWRTSAHPKDVQKSIVNGLTLTPDNLEKMDYAVRKVVVPQVKEELDFVAKRFGAQSGKRMFVPLHPFQNYDFPSLGAERSLPLVLARPSIHMDSVFLQLPKGYEVEYHPESRTLNSPLGSMEFEIISKAGQLRMVRTLILDRGSYSPEMFEEFRDFFEGIEELESEKLVLVQRSN